MVKSKVWLSLVMLMLSLVLVVTGCSSKAKSPQEILQASMAKAADMKSYTFSGSLKIEELSFASETESADVGAMLSMLKGSDLSWTGVYRADPVHMEVDLSVSLKGDMAVSLNIPFVITEEKMWVKVPNIPFFLLPEDIAGKKFLEIDMKQLAEETGQPMPNVDPVKSQKFVNDVMVIIFDNIDGDQYLSSVKASDAGIPEDVNAKQAIQFKVTKEQVEPFVKAVVEKIAPALLDLFANNAEYREMMGLTLEDIEEAKQDLASANMDELNEGMEEFNKAVKTLDIVSNMGIDANEFLVYNDVYLNTEFEAEGITMKLGIKVVSQTKDVNKEVTLQHPDGPADVITMEEFEARMGVAFGL